MCEGPTELTAGCWLLVPGSLPAKEVGGWREGCEGTGVKLRGEHVRDPLSRPRRAGMGEDSGLLLSLKTRPFFPWSLLNWACLAKRRATDLTRVRTPWSLMSEAVI